MSFEERYYEAPEFWADGMLTNEGNLQRIDETIALIPQGVVSVLDAGCGNGVFPNRLAAARPDLKVTATDRSRVALKYVTTEKFECDLVNIPRADNSFDCVTCLQVVEHLPYPTYRRCLSELARVSGRYLVIGVPCNENLLQDFTRCPKCLAHFNLNFHFRTYDAESIRSLFADYGYRCAVYRNIAPARRLYGQLLYSSLRSLWLGTPVRRFESPICPVCGYENDSFHPVSTSAVQAAPRNPGLKSLIKRFWPSYEVPGYWSIALYERV